MKLIKTANGFKIGKSDNQLKRDNIKGKGNPTNKDIAELLEMILERLDK